MKTRVKKLRVYSCTNKCYVDLSIVHILFIYYLWQIFVETLIFKTIFGQTKSEPPKDGKLERGLSDVGFRTDIGSLSSHVSVKSALY